MRQYLIMPFSIILLVTGCGRDSGGPADNAGETIPVRTLAVVDSIGVELGDSNYVLGAVEGVAYGPDGNIAVLDCASACVRIYSPEGEFVRRIGRRGIGPGELQNIAFLAISEDGLVFISGEGGGILGFHVFDYTTGDWITSEQTMSPPTCLEGADGVSHLRADGEFDVSTGEPVVCSRVCRWQLEADEPEVIYHEISFDYDPSDMGRMITMLWDTYRIAAGFDGRVFVAPYDTQQALVYAYERDGTERFVLDLGYQPMMRTDEELQMERNVLRSRANIMDMDPAPMEPDSYRPLIRGLELDGEGNLWVHRGDCGVPTFEVFDPDGEPIFTAVVDGNPADGDTWRFHLDGHGMLAYAEDPFEGYQKVYILELQ